MICDTGVPYLWSPDGTIAYCIDSASALDSAVVADRVQYFSDRVAEWVPVVGATVGLIVLLLTVAAVAALMK